MSPDGAFRQVNDSIRALANEDAGAEKWEFFCECPDLACHALVSLTLPEFDERRAASPPVPIFAAHMAPRTESLRAPISAIRQHPRTRR